MAKLTCLSRALIVVVLLGYVKAQAPVLDLFGGPASIDPFVVPAGSGEVFSQSIVTNPDVDNIIVSSIGDVLQSVVVELTGIPQGEDFGPESITVDDSVLATGITLTTNVNGQVYDFRLSSGGDELNSRTNYGLLLATLAYQSNLTLSAASISPSRTISVTAFDGFTNASDPQFASINIVTANFEGPVFSELSYSLTLVENSLPGTSVGTVIANDTDGGFSVTYSLAANDGVFSIDEFSGTILVVDSSALDFETVLNFELTVTAIDQHPVSSRSSDVQVIVELENINDLAPVFSEDVYTFSVNEEVFGAFVGQVVAQDGDNVAINYELIGSFGDIFNLNRGTGDIFLLGELDFESLENYQFSVRVTDGAFEDTAMVVVNVVNILDSRPNIEPTGKFIILDLDVEPTQVFLSSPNERTVTELTVSDDSPTLVDGTAQVVVTRGEVVSAVLKYTVMHCD